MIRSDLALNYTQSGILLSAFTITAGISQLPAGWLADRIGPRIVVSVGISGVALAGVLVGLSQTYTMLIVFLVIMAVAGGGYHPAAATTISASVEPQIRGRALGFHLIGGSGSHFVAPLLAAAIALAWGWRGSYITLAIPTLVLGIVLYILLGRHKGMKKIEGGTIGADEEATSTPHRLRRLALFLTLTLSVGALMHAVRVFIPLYLVDNFGVREEAAAALVALIHLAGFWAAPMGGYLSDRFGRIPILLMVCLLAGPVVYLFTIVPYGLWIWVMLLAIGTVNFMRAPTSEAFIVSQASARRRSTMLGIYYFTGREAGGLLAPVMGYLIDRFGFNSSFTIVSAALAAVTLVCSVFLWRSRD
jgi:predicted MFS family arabinose efflux permease